MKKLVLLGLWLVFMALRSHGQSDRVIPYNGFLVDCGATNGTMNEMHIRLWEADDQFIKTGQNNLISMNKTPPQMNSLRSFPNGNRNCYSFPVDPYLTLIRAGFYYGNYDGLSKPPTFDLEFDGNLWASVVTSLSEEPIFHEVFYTPTRKNDNDKLEVCLVRKNEDGGVPFISSLEVTTQDMDFDAGINMTKTALYLHSRNRFGSNQQVGGLDRPHEDDMNRIWTPKSTPDYVDQIPEFYANGTLSGAEYSPPIPVISFAIQAHNLSSTIFMPIDFPSKTPVQAFFVFYFSKVYLKKKEAGKRLIQVFIDGREKGAANVSEVYGICSVISVYPVTVVGFTNVTISAAENATLPAFINAMEVFTVIEVLKNGHYNGRNYFSVLFPLVFCFFSILIGG